MLQQVNIVTHILISSSVGIKEIGLSIIVVVFIIVIFIIAHCRNMQNIVPNGATATEALIISSAVVQEGSSVLFQIKE